MKGIFNICNHGILTVILTMETQGVFFICLCDTKTWSVQYAINQVENVDLRFSLLYPYDQ